MIGNMSHERYIELTDNIELKLTEKEIKDGWHFCADFDGLLIHKSHHLFKYCCCFDDVNEDKDK